MPSQFEQDFAGNAAPDLYDAFGLVAAYTAPDGTITAGVAIRIHRNEAHQVEQSRERGELQTAEVMVLQSSLPKPVRGGRFAVEGVEVWTIASTPVLKNGQFYCSCQRTGVERVAERREK